MIEFVEDKSRNEAHKNVWKREVTIDKEWL